MKRKTRSVTLWSQRNVPEDVWPEILSRLPVKSLLRFRCVSKRWLAMIGDSKFARLHLTRFRNNSDESHLFVVEGDYRKQKCFVKSTATFRTTATLKVLESDRSASGTLRSTFGSGPSVQSWHILCSDDGLFMLSNYNPETPDLLVWNPSIRKTLILPPCPERTTIDWFEFGLGFDPLIEDYKYVRFAKSGDLRLLAVYTFGTNLWKTIEHQEDVFSDYFSRFNLYTGQRTLCCKGFLYAIEISCLVSFDLSKEVVDTIRLPELGVSELPFVCHVLTMADGGNSIAMVYNVESEGSVWVLERLGWTKRYAFSTTILQYERILNHRLLYLKKNGEMLLNRDESVMRYNFETRLPRMITKKRFCLRFAWPYIESLLLL